MPLKYFIVDDKKLEVKDVLEKGLLSDQYPLAYLQSCAGHRNWKGKASTTQCLNGTRLEYLKITCDYATRPDSSAFMILGTRSHAKLENLTPKRSFAELYIPDQEITGIVDLVEQQPNGDWWLIDYKTSGAFGIKKSLGLVKKTRPAFDQDGNPVLYQKSGKWGKAGEQKTEAYYEQDPTQRDIKNWQLQLNNYRMMVEKYFDITIAKLKVFAIVRDGGTVTAKNYGIDRNTYYIDVPFMDNTEVESFFHSKASKLISHLKSYDETESWQDSVPPMCSSEECWDGNRCQRYCDVAEFCQQLGDNPYLEVRI